MTFKFFLLLLQYFDRLISINHVKMGGGSFEIGKVTTRILLILLDVNLSAQMNNF